MLSYRSMGACHGGDQRGLDIDVQVLVIEQIRDVQIQMYWSLSQSRLEMLSYRCMGACHRLDQRCLDIDVQELVIEKIRDVQLQMYGSLSQSRLKMFSYRCMGSYHRGDYICIVIDIWELVKELDLNRNPYNLNIIGYSVYIYFFIKYVKLQMN